MDSRRRRRISSISRNVRAGKSLLAVFVILLAAASSLPAQEPERFFDTAEKPRETVRLTIFNPSTLSINALLALKKEGLIPYDNLEIVGIHYEKERTDYSNPEKNFREKGPAWIHFHVLRGELQTDALYRRNALSAELEKIFDLSSGVIFFGGPDIIPSLYGEKTSLLTMVEDPWRHAFELTAVFHLLGGFQDPAFQGYLEKRPDFPVLGICLGLQTLNVGTGGTLVQDIWTETYGLRYAEEVIALGQPGWHTNPNRRLDPLAKNLLPYMLHPIRLVGRGGFVASLGYGPDDQPSIMSAHHQAAKTIGRGFRPAATSLDGKVVEAIEHERFPNVLGVQFHPEFPLLWNNNPLYRIRPGDEDLFGCKSYLESHPPSLDFHKKLWTWFFGSLNK